MTTPSIYAHKTWGFGPILYDSRLEADWAYTLRIYNVMHRYHPGGVQLKPGVRYEPDFLLSVWPDRKDTEDVILEVKGWHLDRVEKPVLAWELNDGGVVIGFAPDNNGHMQWLPEWYVLAACADGHHRFMDMRAMTEEQRCKGKWFGTGGDWGWEVPVELRARMYRDPTARRARA